ncbi:hypothetical protein BG004_002390 [Podila humilis]|nr:hypothetical protein BG004_002390 [Podila humilis]
METQDIQSFKYELEDEDDIITLSTRFSNDTGKEYVLWTEIYSRFPDIYYLEDSLGQVVPFTQNKRGERREPLQIECRKSFPYTVIHHNHRRSPFNANCKSILSQPSTVVGYTTPRIFIILPTDLVTLKLFNLAAHEFRLYFLCDNVSTLDRETGHLHLANHPGYIVTRLKSFVRDYGDYVLQVLLMIKHGYNGNDRMLPSLNASKILWGCDPKGALSHLNNNIESLVVGAIDYLQKHSPPKWQDYQLTPLQSVEIQKYLQAPKWDNEAGNLHRYSDANECVYWYCQVHVHQPNQSGLLKMNEIDENLIDEQQAVIKTELYSKSEAMAFLSTIDLDRFGSHFRISIKFSWQANRQEIEKICRTVASLDFHTLVLDGIDSTIHPYDILQYSDNLFAHKCMRNNQLNYVTLLDYPAPGEQFIHINNYGIHLQNPPSKFTYSWYVLGKDLMRFGSNVCGLVTYSAAKETVQAMQESLERHGLSQVTRIFFFMAGWSAIFDLASAGFVELISAYGTVPEVVLSSKSLLRLGWDVSILERETYLRYVMSRNPQLKELCVSTGGRDPFKVIKEFVRFGETMTMSFVISALERKADTCGHVVVRGIVGDDTPENTARQGNNDDDSQHILHFQNLSPVPNDHIEPEYWHFPPSDLSIFFLKDVIQNEPQTLVSFTLDIAGLSSACVSNLVHVFGWLQLERLRIECSPVEPLHAQAVTQILCSILWPILKELVMSGTRINEWTELWPLEEMDPRLFGLQIIGGGSELQHLSHKSALVVHHLISASPLVDLILENIVLQVKHDWCFILEGVESATLEMFGLCNSSFHQLLSFPTQFAKLFLTPCYQQTGRRRHRCLSLSSLDIDSSELLMLDLVPIRSVFRECCCIQNLTVNCMPPDDAAQNNSRKDIFDTIPWSLLRSLTLSGDHMDEWIQALKDVTLPNLVSLCLSRPGRQQHQPLSQASAMTLQQLRIKYPRLVLHLNGVKIDDLAIRELEGFDTSFLDILCPSRIAIREQFERAANNKNYNGGGSLISKLIDVGSLSEPQLRHLEKQLRSRSNTLQELHVICSHFDFELTEPVSDVFGSVPWSGLKSLTFQGTHLEECVRLLAPEETPNLELLEIRGVDWASQSLSLASALVLQTLIGNSPLALIKQVKIEKNNVHLERFTTRELQYLNMNTLHSVGLFQKGEDTIQDKDECEVSTETSKATATTVNEGAVNPESTVTGSYILETPWSLKYMDDQMEELEKLTGLNHLYVVCKPVDPRSPMLLIGAVKKIHWRTLTSLSLVGESINQWLEHCNYSESLALEQLWICCTKVAIAAESSATELTEKSAKVLEGFVRDCSSLQKLSLQNVVLHDPEGWVELFSNVGFAMEKIELCPVSSRHVQKSERAATLYRAWQTDENEEEEEEEVDGVVDDEDEGLQEEGEYEEGAVFDEDEEEDSFQNSDTE